MRNNTKKTVYILTEGETEVAYFSRIADYVNEAEDWNYSVTVEVREIEDGVKQDPVGMVKEAKFEKKDKGYWKVWVVFDKDRERDNKNHEAIELAQKSKINIAFSSISFEHWLILHFEKNNYPFERSDCSSRSTKTRPIVCDCDGMICALTYLKKTGYYPSYTKGKALIYDDLKSRNEYAFENAAWLRKQKYPNSDIHTLNPYTDVDFLLSELLDLKLSEYISIGQTFSFNGVDISLYNFSKNANKVTVTLNVNNQGTIAFPMNNNQDFILTDNQNNVCKYKIEQPLIVFPGNQHNFDLNFKINSDSTNLTFKAKAIDKNFLVDLF